MQSIQEVTDQRPFQCFRAGSRRDSREIGPRRFIDPDVAVTYLVNAVVACSRATSDLSGSWILACVEYVSTPTIRRRLMHRLIRVDRSAQINVVRVTRRCRLGRFNLFLIFLAMFQNSITGVFKR